VLSNASTAALLLRLGASQQDERRYTGVDELMNAPRLLMSHRRGFFSFAAVRARFFDQRIVGLLLTVTRVCLRQHSISSACTCCWRPGNLACSTRSCARSGSVSNSIRMSPWSIVFPNSSLLTRTLPDTGA
jgi:hypothetical protein